MSLITTGFILAPEVAVWYGDPGRLRLFIDGVELDPINVRNGGIADLATVPLWSLEDVFVERAAGELRVHLRSWRVERTTPSTRTDVLTGSENLNLYRGWFGKRFGTGIAAQLGAQQQSTASRGGMDGDALGAIIRLGWARGAWSVDGTLIRQGVNRNAGDRFLTTNPQAGTLPPFKGSEGVAYARAAWRDPNADGPWIQLIASTISAGESHNASSRSSLSGTSGSTQTTADSVDTTAVRAQYVASAGIGGRGLRLGTTNRLRSIGSKSYFSPGARLEFDARWLTVSAFAERGVDSTTRIDLLGRLAPFPWLNVGAAASRATPAHASLGAETTASRVEAGLRLWDRWLTAGVVRRSASRLSPPIELDKVLRAVETREATGTFASFRGPLLRGWALDADVMNWNKAGPYRPQTEARGRLWFASSFLGRFPRGTFHVLASGTYEYRSTTFVPLDTNAFGQRAAGFSSLGTLLEIRIGTAVLSWQTRNLVGTIYETYPGYMMPRIVNVYGVRWEFWN